MDTLDYDVANPFAGDDRYHCFACDPNHTFGLRLRFHRNADTVTAVWDPGPGFEGYPGVVHGGIQATLADEIGGWYIYSVFETAGVTRDLSISYEVPAKLDDAPFTIIARAQERSPKHALIAVEIRNARDECCATARVTYALFSEAVARKRFFFPGAEAFRPR